MPHMNRAKANIEVVVEQICRSLPHGGDAEVRAFIAHRLADAVQAGLTTLGELGIVGRKALADYEAGRSESSTTRAHMVDPRPVQANPGPNDSPDE
jgi:hypothetical protein